MELYTSEEFNLKTFEAWGGAVNILEEIKELDIVGEAQEYIQEMLSDVEFVTPTDVNDLLWFDMDDFIQYFKEEEDEEDE